METNVDRRGVLRGAVMGGAAVAATGLIGGTVNASAAAPGTARPRRAGVSLRWLGVAGWEMAFDEHVIYVDPYLSRFNTSTNGGALATDPAVADRLLATGRLTGPPELILVSHGHYDHLSEVPSLLQRPQWTSATIRTIGTDTVRNLMIAMETPPSRMARFIESYGGEDLDFGSGAFRVQVLRSLHSQSRGYGVPIPGIRVSPPAKPANIADLVEGGTLAYQVSVADRLSVLFFGGTNFVERELVGLRPDVVMVCMTDFSSLHKYLERLLTVLGGPRFAIPVHNDDMVTGYDDPNLPNTVNQDSIKALKAAVHALRLRTEVLAPQHLVPLEF